MRIVQQYKLSAKIVSVTTNGAANVSKAMDDFCSHQGHGTRISCFAHCLNLNAKHAMESNEELNGIRKMSALLKDAINFLQTSDCADGTDHVSPVDLVNMKLLEPLYESILHQWRKACHRQSCYCSVKETVGLVHKEAENARCAR